MPNRLINETSPYLLQHAHNPVDWYPWGEEALQKAKLENKPIFLSIGYAACHWCHVMEEESFNNPHIANYLNQHFVPIKVDREERPDLDNLYMSAVVSMTGQGGWPMSVFLTPDLKPFYGGTYFPPVPRYGMPAFIEVLEGIQRIWQTDRQNIDSVSEKISEYLQETNQWHTVSSAQINPERLVQAANNLIQAYDHQYGGWGRAPKFPQPMVIEFLLHRHLRNHPEALAVAEHALSMMQRGGLFDVVGGGFHRYSTDSRWLVPHFEKMLYDNALLAQVYLHAYLLTGNFMYRYTCERTLDFILQEMTHLSGGFYSSLDADSEGEEGKYYLWSKKQILQAIQHLPEGEIFQNTFLLPDEGNFEGKIILQSRASLDILAEEMGVTVQEYLKMLDIPLKELYRIRGERIRPHTDDKIIVSWNALALRAFAEAGHYLQRDDYLRAAQNNANFILENLIKGDILYRTWRAGVVRTHAFLEDYAGLTVALLTLYQFDGNPHWYSEAKRLSEWTITRFQDTNGGFFDAARESSNTFILPKYPQDNPIPSGNALAAHALMLLWTLEETTAYEKAAMELLTTLQQTTVEYPTAFAYWLQVQDFAAGPIQQIVLVYPSDLSEPVLNWFNPAVTPYHPRRVLVHSPLPVIDNAPQILKDKILLRNQPTVYICQNFSCRQPLNDFEQYVRIVSEGF
ncbi:MAG: thioredoxin domain-containing protein [Bellilinea sp.]|nr:MAG: thioredoxin domain-containing protein [Bellilinea sp.]